MSSFDYLWQLIGNRGCVADFYKSEAARVWSGYTLEQQREIYRAIRDKLNAGNFVHYNPVKAIRENVPKERRQQQLSYNDYYRTYGTTEEVDGWRRVFLPQLEKTIYVK